MPPLTDAMQASVTVLCGVGLTIFIAFAFIIGVLKVLGESVDPD